ncbi:metallophosphoesterase [Metabacillus fastidiosus]|uniref:metallophosphoesterase n=1 Tax=Metabacillus fastidiosus TaxID=1458 RepID=UPI003D283805
MDGAMVIVLWIFISLFIIGVLICLYMFKKAMENNLVNHRLTFSDFPESFGEVNIFFISDIHRRKVSKRLLNQINKQVDFVIIGGDLTEKRVPFSRVEQNIKELVKIGPAYFVWGNNDYEVDYHSLDALLLEHGVSILDNTARSFESPSGEKLILLGVDDPTLGRDRLELALFDSEEDGFKILVSHNPVIHKKVKDTDNISFILSGHTHGGQIRFLNFGLYEKGALHQFDQYSLLVSNGYGTSGVPLRLGAPAETHLITISKEQ